MSLRDDLLKTLNQESPQSLIEKFSDYACVSAILTGPDKNNLSLGYIRRSVQERDRWSGQIAFPGGRREDFDKDDLATALRETKEEIGVELQPQELLGRLDDIQARKRGMLLDFFIRPFVFYVERDLTTQLDPEEVADFFWIPVRELKDPSRQMFHEFSQENTKVQLPAVRMETEPPLWGLTYMMTQELLRRLK